MHIEIKGKSTIEEFKEEEKKMSELAKKYFEIHKNSCENWNHGNPVKVWWEKDWRTHDLEKVLCIEYEDGKYWHYNESGECW